MTATIDEAAREIEEDIIWVTVIALHVSCFQRDILRRNDEMNNRTIE